MKRTMKSILSVATLAVAAQTMPAQAINREWSAVAGFVGGLLVANAAQCNRSYAREVVVQQPVIVHQPVVVHQPAPVVVVQQPVPSGYYRWETRREWVPGCWVYENRGCGTSYKVWNPGYYRTVRHQVWVDTTYTSCGW